MKKRWSMINGAIPSGKNFNISSKRYDEELEIKSVIVSFLNAKN